MIKDNISHNENTLVVLPSKALCEDYAKNIVKGVKIISGENGANDNVQGRLMSALASMQDVVIITHAAFLDCSIPQSLKSNYNLIIDEAFDPWREQKYHQEKNDQIFAWDKLVIPPKEEHVTEYVPIVFNDMLTNSVTCKSPFIRDVSSLNWTNYVLRTSHTDMLVKRKLRIMIIQELDPSVMFGWESVHVAAAAFEYTFMNMWFQKHAINHEITHKFEKHSEFLNIYSPHMTKASSNGKSVMSGIAWSKNKKTTMSWFQDQFQDHFKSRLGDDRYLRLSNTTDKKNNNKVQILNDENKFVFVDQEVVMPHNVAGMNKFDEIESVVLESALNPSPQMGKWLVDVAVEFLNLDDDIEVDRYIFNARAGYIYYQVLMRCCLRKNLPADVYVLDERGIDALTNFFNQMEINDWCPNQPIDFKPKQVACTNAENIKASRLRKKYPEKYAGLKTREILDSL